jgi:hypothetical protein
MCTPESTEHNGHCSHVNVSYHALLLTLMKCGNKAGSNVQVAILFKRGLSSQWKGSGSCEWMAVCRCRCSSRSWARVSGITWQRCDRVMFYCRIHSQFTANTEEGKRYMFVFRRYPVRTETELSAVQPEKFRFLVRVASDASKLLPSKSLPVHHLTL